MCEPCIIYKMVETKLRADIADMFYLKSVYFMHYVGIIVYFHKMCFF